MTCDNDLDGKMTVTVSPLQKPAQKQKKLSKLHRKELYKIATDTKDGRNLDALNQFFKKSRNPEEEKIRTLINIHQHGPGRTIIEEYMGDGRIK